MKEDIGKKTKKSLYWNVALKIPYEIFRFATSILVARLLDPEDFGIVSIATITVFYANSFTNFGFNQALVQRKEINQKHINSVFTFDLSLSVLLSFVIFTTSGYVADFFNSPKSEDAIKVLSAIFLMTAIHDLPYVLLRRDIDFKLLSIVDMLREVSMSILTLFLAYYGYAYWSLVWGVVIPQAVASIYLFNKVNYEIKLGYSHRALMELFDFSKWSFIQMQIYFVCSRIDRIIIGKFINPAMLGIYEKSKGLTRMPAEAIGDQVNIVLFSSFSRAQGDHDHTERLFKKGLVILSSMIFPMYIGLYSTASHFIIVLLGEKWSGMILSFEIMALGGLLATVNGLLSAILVGSGFLKHFTMCISACTLVLIIGCFAFVSYGIEAIAAVLVLFNLCLLLLTFKLVKRIFGISLIGSLAALWPATASGIVLLIVVLLLKQTWLAQETFVNFLILALFGGISYAITMIVIPSHELDQIRGPIYQDLKSLLGKV